MSVLLFAFLFLTPADKPDGHVETAVPSVPEMNIRRRFGEKTFLAVDGTGIDARLLRLQLGIVAWQKSADGVVCKSCSEAAIAGAKADTAVLDKLEELRAEAMNSSDSAVRLLGRKAGHLIANLDLARDPDLTHLEALAVLRPLEGALKRPAMPVAEAVKASLSGVSGKDVASPPLPPEAKTWPRIELQPGLDRRPLGDDFFYALRSDFRWLSFGVKGKGALKKGEGPGGALKVRLWIPDTVPGAWTEYDMTLSLETQPDGLDYDQGPEWAPDPCRQLYEHERRYPDKYPTPAAFQRFVCAEKRPWGRDCPQPRFTSWWWEGDSPTTWWAKLDFLLVDVFDRMPMRKPGVADIWYATISYGEKSTSVRFVWPKGRDANVFTMLEGIPIESVAQKCHPDYEAVDREWGWGDDDRFYRDFVKPLLEADKELIRLSTLPGIAKPPPIKKEVPAARLKFYREYPRLLYVAERVRELRKQYLLDLLEGREPKPPTVRMPTQKKSAKGPTLDDSPDSLDLDEEVL